MVGDLKKVKEQIAEIVDVVNSFKSEAVQLRVVELLFQHIEIGERASQEIPKVKSKVRTPRQNFQADSGEESSKKQTKSNGRSPSKFGAQTALNRLIEEGYFKSKRIITDIVGHCESQYARKLKPNAFSGKLGRAVRSGALKREKNADGQYEYFS